LLEPPRVRDERNRIGAVGVGAGGAGGIRTPDIRLAKAALSQLSYGPAVSPGTHEWWAILDSNQGPQSYQDCALTN
jgi:hypothetical protein